MQPTPIINSLNLVAGQNRRGHPNYIPDTNQSESKYHEDNYEANFSPDKEYVSQLNYLREMSKKTYTLSLSGIPV